MAKQLSIYPDAIWGLHGHLKHCPMNYYGIDIRLKHFQYQHVETKDVSLSADIMYQYYNSHFVSLHYILKNTNMHANESDMKVCDIVGKVGYMLWRECKRQSFSISSFVHLFSAIIHQTTNMQESHKCCF